MNVFSKSLESHRGDPIPLRLYTSSNEFLRTEEDLVLVDRQSIFDAVRHDSKFPLLVSLLLGGVSPNEIRKLDGATPLHLAFVDDPSKSISDVVSSHLSLITQSPCPNRLVMSFLLENGADINARALQGETPLMVAASRHNMVAMRVLLQKGANVEIRDKAGRTVLSYLALYPVGLALIKEFLGNERFMEMGREENLLHQVCHRAGSTFPALYLVEQLGFDVNAAAHSTPSSAGWSTVRDGFTPLHCAVTSGDLELTKALVRAGADIHKPDAFGVSAVLLSRNATLADVRASREDFSPLSKGQRVDSTEIRRFLCKCESSTSSAEREKLLKPNDWRRPTFFAQLFEACTFAAMASFPSLILYFFSCLTSSIFLLSLLSLSFVLLFFSMRQADNRGLFKVQGTSIRSFRCFGCFVGFIVVLGIHLLTFPSVFYRISVSDHWDSMKSCYYVIFFFALGMTVTLSLVLVSSPGFVSSATAAGQRKGIYTSFLKASEEKHLPKDLEYGVDWDLMLKKPMRAQHCKVLNQLVLRYDGYSSFVASSIGAGNHRLYIFFQLFLGALLCTTYFFTNIYCPKVARSLVLKVHADPTQASVKDSMGWEDSLVGVEDWDDFFRIPSHRFFFVYSQILVPVVLVVALANLFSDLLNICWNLTDFDLKHAETQSSLYCFQLKASVFSLYDKGVLQNLKDFFFFGEDFRALRYRPPELSDRLKEKIQDFQRKEILLSTENHSHCSGNHSPPHASLSSQFSPAPNTSAVTHFHEESAEGSVSAVHISLSHQEALVQKIFQELIRTGGSAELSCPSDLDVDEWNDVTNKATEMYHFFKTYTSGGA